MHAPCSNYRSILSSGSYYLEDFDYRSILVYSGTIVHWSALNLSLQPSTFVISLRYTLYNVFYSLVAVLHYRTIWCGIISVEFPQDTPSELLIIALAFKYHLMNSNVLTFCN